MAVLAKPHRSLRVAETDLRTYFAVLYRKWGCQHWWPAHSRFEVIVGAYLTQNTSWTNVELALERLRVHRSLTLAAMRAMPLSRLETMVRSAGYFRQKARRLKLFIQFLDKHYCGSLSQMFAQPTEVLRPELLALEGVGPETADSILLYAGQHPVFVVDAYTRRILERHGLLPANAPYEEIRAFCERALAAAPSLLAPGADHDAEDSARAVAPSLRGAPGTCHAPSAMSLARRTPLAQIYNDMHGLIVGVGKNYCLKSQPKCDQCPLQAFLPRVR